MGQDINVEIKAVSSCGTKSVSTEIFESTRSSVIDSGAEFREALEAFSNALLGKDCQIKSESGRDFEADFRFWKKADKEELWDCPEGDSDYSLGWDGPEMSWKDMESYQPSWWTPLPEVSGEEVIVTLYAYKQTDYVTLRGVTEEAAIEAAVFAFGDTEVEFVRTGSTVVDSYGNKLDLSTLSVEEQEKFGVRYTPTPIPVPEELKKAMNISLGNYADDGKVTKSANRSLGIILDNDYRLNNSIKRGDFAMWQKGGQKYIYAEPKSLDFLSKLAVLGVIDLSEYHIEGMNSLFIYSYHKWLEEKGYRQHGTNSAIDPNGGYYHTFVLEVKV